MKNRLYKWSPDVSAIHRILSHEYEFKKSSFSKFDDFCVGVCMTESSVKIKNTKQNNGDVIDFTHKEWEAFIKGVKNGEFDLAF